MRPPRSLPSDLSRSSSDLYHTALKTALAGMAEIFGIILGILICSSELASTNGIAINKIFVIDANNKPRIAEEEQGQSAAGLERSSFLGKLTVKMVVTNICLPQSFCENIGDEDFLVKIFTFENNTLKEFGTIPGGGQEWTVYFYPQQSLENQSRKYSEGNKYVVQSEVQNKTKFERILVNTTYSQDCRATIKFSNNQTCTIINLLWGPP